VDNINYDPYGNVVYQSASSAQPCFLYNGMQYDAATGMYYSVRRWYDPVNGNWLSQDPIGFAGGQTNTSEFVGNSPTNGIDPSGMNDSLSFSGAGSKSFPAPAPPDCTLVVPNTPITASMIDLAAQKASAGLPAYVGSVSGPGSGGGAPRPVGLAEGAWLSTYVVWGNYARSIFKTGGKIIETFSLGNLQPNKSQFMKDRDDYMDYAYKRLNMTGPDSPFNLRTNIETFTNLLSAYFFLSGEGEGAGADTTVGGDFVEGDMNGGSFDDPSAIGDPVSSAQAAPTDILPGGTPAPDGGGTIPPSPNMPNGGWYRENPHSFGGDVIEYPTYPSGVPPQSVPPTWRLPPAPQPPAFPPGVPRLTPQRPWWPPQAGNG
jgi:RHS repeat-associated protein